MKNYRLFANSEIDLGDDGIFKFDPLKITQEKEIMENYLRKHPVIFIDLKDIKGDSYE